MGYKTARILLNTKVACTGLVARCSTYMPSVGSLLLIVSVTERETVAVDFFGGPAL